MFLKGEFEINTNKVRSRLCEWFEVVAILGDVLTIKIGLCVGFWFRYKVSAVQKFASRFHEGQLISADLHDHYANICLGVVLFCWFLAGNQLYQKRNILKVQRVGKPVVKGCFVWAISYLSLSLVFKVEPEISRINVVMSSLVVGFSLLAWRFFLNFAMKQSGVFDLLKQRVLFVGESKESKLLADAIRSDLDHPYTIVSIPDVEQGMGSGMSKSFGFGLGSTLPIGEMLLERGVDIVLLSESAYDNVQSNILANICEKAFVEFKVIPSGFTILLSGLRLETISGVPILGISELAISTTVGRIKRRLVDVVGAIVGLFISLPVIAVLSVFIIWESPGPVFFRQERVGRRGKVFTMYKLRSMALGADQFDNKNQSTQRDDPRLLRVGSLIRRWNLDELPQFLNVLFGQMSLVGPRPERTYHSDVLSGQIPHYKARLLVKPGMTGWAQIHGLRGDTDLSERVRYDLYYLENWSVILDFQIMLYTLFRSKNAY
jgi:exopolysaccharide biosynthesis polyprenyl glycosylphosphotransferase